MYQNWHVPRQIMAECKVYISIFSHKFAISAKYN